VTWGATIENPGSDVPYLWQPPLPPPERDETGEITKETPPPPFLPVSIDCVTDTVGSEKQVHFFDMTRLGAYLVVPLMYRSYYEEEDFEEAKKFELNKKTAAEERAKLQEEYDEKKQQAVADGGDAAAVQKPEGLEEKEEPVMELKGKLVKMVLCIDTLGTNTAIPESKFEPLMALCAACGKCKEKTEKRQVGAQAIHKIKEETETSLRASIQTIRARFQDDTELDEKGDRAEVEPDERQGEEVHKKWEFQRAVKVLLAMKEEFLTLKQWVVVPPVMLDIFAATALLFGYKKAELYPKRKAKLRWDVLCKILDERFLRRIKEADVLIQKKGIEEDQKLVNIKARIPKEYDSKTADEVSPVFCVLFDVLNTACEYRKYHLELKKDEYNKRKTAAEEKEEEFTEESLVDIDDDYAAPEDAQ